VHSLLDSLNGAIHSMQRSVERMRSSIHDDHYGHGRGYHGESRYGHGRGNSSGVRYGSRYGSGRYSSRAELAAGVLRFAFSRSGH